MSSVFLFLIGVLNCRNGNLKDNEPKTVIDFVNNDNYEYLRVGTTYFTKSLNEYSNFLLKGKLVLEIQNDIDEGFMSRKTPNNIRIGSNFDRYVTRIMKVNTDLVLFFVTHKMDKC